MRLTSHLAGKRKGVGQAAVALVFRSDDLPFLIHEALVAGAGPSQLHRLFLPVVAELRLIMVVKTPLQRLLLVNAQYRRKQPISPVGSAFIGQIVGGAGGAAL